MGYKQTIVKAVKNSNLQLDNFSQVVRNIEVIDNQTVRFNIEVKPVFGDFRIDTKYSSNPQPSRFIEVDIKVYGRVTIRLACKPELRTKDFLKFVDLFNVNLSKIIEKALYNYKVVSSLKTA